MRPVIRILAAVTIFAVPLFAQDAQREASPRFEILGPELIAWSQMQQPQPIQQPMPGAQDRVQQPDPQSQEGRAQQEAQEQAARTFRGLIKRDGGEFVLSVEGANSLQLDDQERAKRYEGKQVRVDGTVDSSGRRLRIINIELIS